MDVSVVIPVYNEGESIGELYNALDRVLKKIHKRYEIIFINDGSTDETEERLERIQERDSSVVVIDLRKNFGQTAAMAAGFAYAEGDIVVTLDGDLQNDPDDIPKLLKEAETYDVVSGWRKDRKDAYVSRRIPSMVANGLISWVTGVYLHDYGCTLKAYRKEVVKNIRLYGEMHRFIPALANWVGASVTEVVTNHRARKYGTSKYGISRIIRVVLDLLTVKFMQTFSTRPIHVFGSVGMAMMGLGGLGLLYLAFVKFAFGQSIGERPLLLLSAFIAVLGVQAIFLGLLGEMLTRTYHESQNKPIFYVRKVLGKEDLVRGA